MMELVLHITEYFIIFFWLILIVGVSYMVYMTIRDDIRKERERKQK